MFIYQTIYNKIIPRHSLFLFLNTNKKTNHLNSPNHNFLNYQSVKIQTKGSSSCELFLIQILPLSNLVPKLPFTHPTFHLYKVSSTFPNTVVPYYTNICHIKFANTCSNEMDWENFTLREWTQINLCWVTKSLWLDLHLAISWKQTHPWVTLIDKVGFINNN